MTSERKYASHALAVVSNASCGVAFDGSDIALALMKAASCCQSA